MASACRGVAPSPFDFSAAYSIQRRIMRMFCPQPYMIASNMSRVALQTAVALHVPDHRLDGCPAHDVPAQRRGHAFGASGASRGTSIFAINSMCCARATFDRPKPLDRIRLKKGSPLDVANRQCTKALESCSRPTIDGALATGVAKDKFPNLGLDTVIRCRRDCGLHGISRQV